MCGSVPVSTLQVSWRGMLRRLGETWSVAVLIALVLPVAVQAQSFSVSNNNDSGSGSLRRAIDDANAYSASHGGAATTITIQAGVGTIRLGSNLPLIAGSTTIAGNGAVLDGASTYRGFLISGIASDGQNAAATTVAISNLTIQNVKAQGGNGADSGGGGLGAGGAVFVGPAANVTLSNVSVANAAAVGGNGAAFSNNGTGGGGGLGGNGGGTTVGGGIGGGGGGGLLFAGGTSNNGNGGGGGGITSAGGAGTAASGGDGGAGLNGLGGGGGGVGGSGVAAGGTGAGAGGGSAGSGGFGGGGGGGGTNTDSGAHGGFGGGGGGGDSHAGRGGFGGGGGGSDNQGGAGGFGGGGAGTFGVGGFGGGAGGTTNGGGGGAMGGAIFVAAGGSLTIDGAGSETGGTVTAGAGSGAGSTGGTAYGSGIFFEGGAGGTPSTLTFGTGNQSVADVIADLNGSAGNATTGNGLGGTGGITALAKTGTGTLTLQGANTFTGGTTVSGGGLVNFNSANNFGSGNITLDNGGLQWASGTTTDISSRLNAIGSGGATFDYNGNTVTLATGLTGSGGITVADTAGGGSLILSGASSYVGATAVNAGTLQAGAANVFAPSSDFVIASGATLDLNNFNETIGSLAGAGSVTLGSGTLTLAGNANTIFSGTISGTGGNLIKNGNATLLLTGTSSYTGTTDVNAGTLRAGVDNTFATGSAFSVASGATLDLEGFNETIGSLAGGGSVTLGAGTLTMGGNTASTVFSGTVSGTGGLTKTGTGTFVLSGTSNYSGATNVNDGTFQAGAAGAFAPSSAFTVANSATLDLNGFDQTIGSLAGTGNVTLGAGTLTMGGNNASTSYSGTMSGSGGLTKTGSGTFTLLSGLFYTGATNINGGTFQAGSGAAAFASPSAYTIASGATLDLNGFNQMIGSLAGAGNVTLGTAQLMAGGNNASTAFSGVISGNGGSLDKTGSGTLILTGSNTYTGGTRISAGTLQLGNGGAGGSIVGNVVDDATFIVDRSDTYTFGGAISGSGVLVKTGTGRLILTGTSSYAGDTTIDGGTLEVDGAITNSANVNVTAGGVLTGTGTVDPNTISIGATGTLIPGAAGVPGTSTTIAGNLVFQHGASYIVYLDQATSTFATVTGTAQLAGSVTANFSAGSYSKNTVYTILHSAGLGGSTFDSLTTVNTPGFGVSLGYTATDVQLTLNSATLGIGQNLTQNQQHVADALSNFFNSGGALPSNFMTVFGLTGSSLAYALDQLSGEAATASQQSAFQLMTQFLGLMTDPFLEGRREDSDGGLLGYAESSGVPAGAARAYASILKAPAAKFEQRWAAWVTGFGGGSRLNGDAIIGSHDVTANTYGTAAGLDYHIAPGTFVGFAIAGAGTNWSLSQGLGSGRSDAFQAGVYGRLSLRPAYISAAFAVANHWMSTDRTAFAGDHLTASFNAQSIGGRIEAGYRFEAGRAGVTPYAALQAQSFRTPAYGETDATGGGFALNYDERSAYDTRSELGARFDWPKMIGGMPLMLRLGAAWAHDWVSTPSLAADFQALPGQSFIVTGAAPAKDSLVTTGGLELQITRSLSLVGKFDGEFADGAQVYAGTGTLRYRW